MRSVSIEFAAFAISNLNRFTFPRFAKSHKTHENKFPIKWSARYWSTIDFRNSKGLGCRTGHQRFQSHQELSLKFPKPKEQGRGRLFEQHFPTLQQYRICTWATFRSVQLQSGDADKSFCNCHVVLWVSCRFIFAGWGPTQVNTGKVQHRSVSGWDAAETAHRCNRANDCWLYRDVVFGGIRL